MVLDSKMFPELDNDVENLLAKYEEEKNIACVRKRVEQSTLYTIETLSTLAFIRFGKIIAIYSKEIATCYNLLYITAPDSSHKIQYSTLIRKTLRKFDPYASIKSITILGVLEGIK